jgi:hypothetical protein
MKEDPFPTDREILNNYIATAMGIGIYEPDHNQNILDLSLL